MFREMRIYNACHRVSRCLVSSLVAYLTDRMKLVFLLGVLSLLALSITATPDKSLTSLDRGVRQASNEAWGRLRSRSKKGKKREKRKGKKREKRNESSKRSQWKAKERRYKEKTNKGK